MEIRTIGIDLGKTVFHLAGVNARGEVVVRKKCSRLQLLRFTSNLRECLIGMEACGGSHFLVRALREQGHDVRLMPAQYVKPYAVKTNKNDYIIKTDDQLDLQSLHRVRERWVVRRTAVINQIRGMLLERGITVAKGRRHIEESLPGILEDPDHKLSAALLNGNQPYPHAEYSGQCRISNCKAIRLPRDRKMTKKTRKPEKAVKKLDKAVRKAVDKGVSQTVVENTVEAAIGKAAKKLPAKKSVALEDDDSDAESATSNPRAVKLKKLPGKTKPPTRTGGFGPGPRH